MNNQIFKGIVYAIESFVGAGFLSIVILIGLNAANISFDVTLLSITVPLLELIVIAVTLYFVSQMSFTSKYVKGINTHGIVHAIFFVVIASVVIDILSASGMLTTLSGFVDLVVTTALFYGFSLMHLRMKKKNRR